MQDISQRGNHLVSIISNIGRSSARISPSTPTGCTCKATEGQGKAGGQGRGKAVQCQGKWWLHLVGVRIRASVLDFEIKRAVVALAPANRKLITAPAL